MLVPMRHAGRTTLLQLLALVPITIAGLVVYWSVTTRMKTPMIRTSAMFRDIQAGMLVYARDNNAWLPGLDRAGVPLADGEITGNSGDGDTLAARYRLLAGGKYVASLSFIDPRDTLTAWTTGRLTVGQFSYAMLDISTTNGSAGARRFSWRDIGDSRTAMVSDRNTGVGTQTNPNPAADANVRGHWSKGVGFWAGYVSWCDGHVSFERSQFMPMTSYQVPIKDDKGLAFKPGFSLNDNLFTSASSQGVTENAPDSEANALMTWP